MKKGFTLLEMMIVFAIFTFLFAAILTVLSTSDRSWRTGQHKFTEQQQARRAMDIMAKLLRQSNPDWVIEGTHYPVSITSNNRIDFYQPVFNDAGAISSLKKITFKLDPSDVTQLLRKDGTQNAAVIATNVESVNFGGGCAACSAFNCSSVSADCPMVAIDITTKGEAGFVLSSKVALRNTNAVLGDDVEVEQPEAGEF
jgi:prepilin-type N-terminal cleavage/methylation domain-containing protein